MRPWTWARQLLDEWTENWHFLEGSPVAKIKPGPYVFAGGKTWQPWKIYNDFNACFMKAFKPSSDGSGK